MSIYTDLINAGQQVDNHESDLYTPVNDITTEILKKHDIKATIFTSQIDNKGWYVILFAYDPFWDSKTH